jgi:hypothetical protein
MDVLFGAGCYIIPSRESSMFRTRTRTNTSPNDTEANAAGRSVVRCAQVKTAKRILCRGQEA